MSSQGRLQASVLTEASQLLAIADEWDALLAHSASNEPMQSSIWLTNWWRVYGAHGGRALCTLALRDEGHLVGLIPLCQRPTKAGIRIELLGSGEDEVDETCSEYIGVIAEEGHEQAVANAFGEALHSGLLGDWQEVVMTAMSSELAMAPLLARGMGRGTRYRVLTGAPFARLPESWDAYLGQLSSSRRALVRKSLRAWEAWSKEPPTLKQVQSPDELDAAIEMLAALHKERWQETGHVGAFDSPLFSAFHHQTMHDLLAVDALWLCWLEVEGKPITALYNIVWNQQVRFYQSGRILDVPKKVRPGLVIHACAIQEATRRGYTHYDFLAGTTRYKMQLANNVRPLIELSLTRPSMRTRLRDLREGGVSLGRSLRSEWGNRVRRDSGSQH